MTLEEAKDMLRIGIPFGDVYPLVNGDGEELKSWYCREPGLPVLTRRVQSNPTGNGCPKCGGQLIRDGKCELCPQCGETVGSCS